MLDEIYVKETLKSLIAHTLPKNARTYSYNIFDFNFKRSNKNALGFYIDPQQFEGKVVAYDDENLFMVVKKGRQAKYSVLDLKYVTNKPKIGRKVRVTPYARHDFNGNRVDSSVINQSEVDGVVYTSRETMLGGNDVSLPVQAVNCFLLKDLIHQLEIMPAPDGIRKISHLLVDAKATDFKLCDPIDCNEAPLISFKAKNKEITISYNYGADAYDFEVKELGNVPITIKEVYFDRLGEVLENLIDDKTWQRIEVIELK